MEKCGVYKIKCQPGCVACYIGQSKRAIGTRFKEHLQHTRNIEPERSNVAKHCINELHSVNNLEIDLIKSTSGANELNFHELLCIQKEKWNNADLQNAEMGNVETVLFQIFKPSNVSIDPSMQ